MFNITLRFFLKFFNVLNENECDKSCLYYDREFDLYISDYDMAPEHGKHLSLSLQNSDTNKAE